MDARRARTLLGAEGEAPLTVTRGWVAIVNPRSRGLTPAALLALRSELLCVVDDVLVSMYAGHAAALVAQCRNAAGIVIGGGDGTIFEVLQACDRARQRLAVVPLGRGNSLAKDLDLTSAARAIRSIAAGSDRTIDLLDVTLRSSDGREWRGVSSSNVAVGYPAEVAKSALRWQWMRGHSYTAASAIVRPTWFSARLSSDDSSDIEARLTGVIVSNSRYVGPFLGFPNADLADGVFHTMELRSTRWRQLAHNISSVTGLRFYEPVVRRDLRSVRLRLDAPVLVKIDGELRDDVCEITVRLLPRAATFRVPARGHA